MTRLSRTQKIKMYKRLLKMATKEIEAWSKFAIEVKLTIDRLSK